MTATKVIIPQNVDPELQQFIESIPTPEVISQRLERNAHESALLKRMLRLSKDKERVESVDRQSEETSSGAGEVVG